MVRHFSVRLQSIGDWLGLLPLIFLISGCYLIQDVRMPCDEKINNPQTYEDIIRASPVIQRLNREAKVRKIDVSPCFNNNRVGILVTYELPVTYSSFDITYTDRLSLIYSKDGTIELSQGTPDGSEQQKSFDTEAILERTRQRINEIEGNPRVKEVITKTEPDPLNPVTPIFGMTTLRKNNLIEYDFFNKNVRGYTLLNKIDWQGFPEIKRAYKIIEEHLLTGQLANCQISRDDRGYVSTSFHETADGPWAMTVLISCDDGWKDVFVRVNSDGSYDNLKIMIEYKNK